MELPYAGAVIALTTRHHKQQALGRVFAVGLGARLQLCEHDTDQLGTFSGEIPRLADAAATCRAKALLGMEATGLPFGLASEASFGPHPAMPMLAVGQELLLFLDQQRGLTVLEQRFEWRTNYSHLELDPNASSDCSFKGVGSRAALEQAIGLCRAADPNGRVWLETDMRAHCNPTRMRSIRRLGLAMVRRLRTPCPDCGSPGWGLLETRPGLPCAECGTATELSLAEIWGCHQCGARREQPRRDGLLRAAPAQCPWCNP